MSTNSTTMQTFSMPRALLHLEGLAILITSLIAYANMEFSWGTFALFLLAPDLVVVIYMSNQRAGSIAYNIVHSIILPLSLALYSVLTSNSLGIQASLIWFAHIGMDHIFGYGFKYIGQFKETHFSRV